MSDLTPPPERPMSDPARARIRAELVRHASEQRSTGRRWPVPAAAAAAVALVAGVVYWAVGTGGSDAGVLPVTGQGTSGVPVPSTSPTPAEPSPSTVSQHVTVSTPSSPPKPTDSSTMVGTGSCEHELHSVVDGPSELATKLPDGSTFYVAGPTFVLCDQLGGRTTIHRPLPLTPDVTDVSTYAVSSLYDDGQVVWVAGGVVPDDAPVYDISYTFSDGHTEHATVTTDADGRSWWYVAYTSPYVGGNESKQPEITVTVSLSGVQHHYSLAWGADTCAQANHGC